MACERCMIQRSIAPDSFYVRLILCLVPCVRIIHGGSAGDENV